MKSMLYQILQQIPDSRRKQGQLFELHNVLFLCIVAILSGATSYREIDSFTKIKFEYFKKSLNLKWKKTPAYCSIRKIILSVDSSDLESVFRKFSSKLVGDLSGKAVSADGKTIRGSFDNNSSKTAMQILMILLSEKDIILAHKEIEDNKTNEIPMLQELVEELHCSDVTYTSDALHCQKKL